MADDRSRDQSHGTYRDEDVNNNMASQTQIPCNQEQAARVNQQKRSASSTLNHEEAKRCNNLRTSVTNSRAQAQVL